ncbi:MAG TPA: hypothetical protein DCS63_06150 [Elusimicrobia bacterium]|nr:hypothetical protein [Elusimicrobiota bacterium]
MVKSVMEQALTLWGSPGVQELLSPVRTLSSISAMFWMLARLADGVMAALKRLLPEGVSILLSILYFIALSVVYAAMMFYPAFEGQWHPSLIWREVFGLFFMYIMLCVTFTDLSTRRLKPLAEPGFFFGVSTYLFLVMVPALVRQPVLAELHRVLQLFAAGGWGNVMTVLTILVLVWSLIFRAVFGIAFSLGPLLYSLRSIKAPFIRHGSQARSAGGDVSLGHSWLVLSLLIGGACFAAYCWPQIRAAGAAAVPAIRSRARSPEAASAAARLWRVLPAVSFTTVNSLPRRGPVAVLSRPVFRRLLSAADEEDRWLAAAALDRVDPDFRISQAGLFRSTAAASAPCVWKGQAFRVLMRPLPGDDPAKTRTYWILDDHGVHFSGLGPGEFQPVAGSAGCAVAVFGSAGGTVLLPFTEAPQAPGAAPHLWLAAYDPVRRKVLAATRAGENASGNFELSAMAEDVGWADAPVSTGPVGCSRACGKVLGSPVLSLATRPLVEYRSASVEDGDIRIMPRSGLTFARSGLGRIYLTLPIFELTFQFDPVAGFLNRWYRLARLSDGRQCVSVALAPKLPGLERDDNWDCDR